MQTRPNTIYNKSTKRNVVKHLENNVPLVASYWHQDRVQFTSMFSHFCQFWTNSKFDKKKQDFLCNKCLAQSNRTSIDDILTKNHMSNWYKYSFRVCKPKFSPYRLKYNDKNMNPIHMIHIYDSIRCESPLLVNSLNSSSHLGSKW